VEKLNVVPRPTENELPQPRISNESFSVGLVATRRFSISRSELTHVQRRHARPRRWAVIGTVVLAVLTSCSDKSDGGRPSPDAAAGSEILRDLSRWDDAPSESRRAAADDVARRMPDFALLRLETFRCGGQTHEVAVFRHQKTALEFVLIPTGRFVMGAPDNELSELDKTIIEVTHRLTVTPHEVLLTGPFLIARTLCTQAAYERIVGSNPSRITRRPDLPVVNVNWIDAHAFCEKAGLDLPTEAQWEYACRAGTTTPWFWGDDWSQIGDYVWRSPPLIDPVALKPVGGKKPNAFGLFDLIGNGYQWCGDYDGEYPTTSVVDPTGPTEAKERHVERGGWFPSEATVKKPSACALSARRGCAYSELGSDIRGFRPAKIVRM
jgi:formylglycine-generating enzyme required for sulfatase activity